MATSLVAQRMRLALDLAELAEAMLRQRLRGKHPSASAEEIDERVRLWRQTRPGAEDGDAVGRLVPWPPRPRWRGPGSGHRDDKV